MMAGQVFATILALGLASGPPALPTTAAVTIPRPLSVAAVSLAKGKFLVAARELSDPNFARTVVLLIDYSAEGAMGVVVNRETELTLSELLPEVEPLKKSKARVFLGGPVMPEELFMLLRTGEEPENSVRVVDDIWVSRSSELLERLAAAKKPEASFHVYAGYAGWGPRQLDAEVARGDWLVVPADADIVFSERPGRVWRALIPPEENPYVTRADSGGLAWVSHRHSAVHRPPDHEGRQAEPEQDDPEPGEYDREPSRPEPREGASMTAAAPQGKRELSSGGIRSWPIATERQRRGR